MTDWIAAHPGTAVAHVYPLPPRSRATPISTMHHGRVALSATLRRTSQPTNGPNGRRPRKMPARDTNQRPRITNRGGGAQGAPPSKSSARNGFPLKKRYKIEKNSKLTSLRTMFIVTRFITNLSHGFGSDAP